MRIETQAIVCAIHPHGEHGAIVRMMTPANGLQAAYVRGGRGRRLRPILIAGNVVQARLRSKSEGQLAQAEVELVYSRAPLLSEALPAAVIEWATTLVATALPEQQAYLHVFEGLDGLLSAVEAAPAASGWGSALVRFELLLLAELGFGLDLESCVVTGSADNLVAVSPRSGRAVSASEAKPYAGKLLPLPAFVREGGGASWEEVAHGLDLSGHFLSRDLFVHGSAAMWDARTRLVDRLRRAGGLDQE